MQNLIAALIKAKSNFSPIKKEKINPYFNSRYADLDAVIAATDYALHAEGLTVTQTVEDFVLITTLWHESGESLTSKYPLPKTEESQKLGASITYARRYSLCAILGVAAEDDNDGNSQPSPNKSVVKAKGEISKEEWLAKQQEKRQANHDQHRMDRPNI